ncbi:MAG: FAD-dependent oxidoreductase, partial [Cryobacterium sp.]|nr:FAD-dependent oxidoreductase [Cryobacterium sp.]
MRVVIAGSGIGGLVCAQGLIRRGFDVTVIEPDEDLAATGGYKFHLGESAVRAIRHLLPARGVEALLGVSVATRGFTLILRHHRGRRLLRAAEGTTGLALDVDRVTLREVLAFGLDSMLGLGRRCEGWREDGESVAVVLDDGSVIHADVLVIADGAGSALAERLAGEPTSTPCGLIGVADRTPWNGVPPATRELLGHESMLAIGSGGTGVFTAKHDSVNRAAVRTLLASPATTNPIAISGLLALDGAFPKRPSQFPAVELLGL